MSTEELQCFVEAIFSSLKKLPLGLIHGLCVSLLFPEYSASGFKIRVKSF